MVFRPLMLEYKELEIPILFSSSLRPHAKLIPAIRALALPDVHEQGAGEQGYIDSPARPVSFLPPRFLAIPIKNKPKEGRHTAETVHEPQQR
jgi:hypothetical protein